MRRGHRVTRHVIAAVAVVTLLFAGHARQRVLWKLGAQQSHQINDFSRWLDMLPRFLREGAPYVDDAFPNPPITLLFLAGFTTMSPANAQFVWAIMKGIMASLTFWLCLRMVRAAGVELTTPAMGLMVAVWIWPVIGDVQHGQTNLLMLLPLVAGLWAAQRERRAWDWLAGALIALAACIKVTPLAFLPYALFRRRWTVAGAIGLGVVLWLLVIPAMAFGWEQNLRWLGQWSRIMLEPYVARGTVEYYGGQSLASFVTRLLRHVPAVVGQHTGTQYYLNIADLPESVVNWVIRGVLGAIALAGAVWARRPLSTFRSRRYILEMGAVAAFMLWASQRTWVPHFVTLILTLFAVGMILSDPAEPARLRRRAWWALAVSAFLMMFTGDAGKVFGPDGHKWARTLGVSLWGSVLQVAVIITARAARSERGTGPRGEPA